MKTAYHIYQFSILYIALLCNCVLTDVMVHEPPDIIQIKTPVPEVQYDTTTHFGLYWRHNRESDLAGYHWNWLVFADSTLVDTLTEQRAIPAGTNWKIFNGAKMEGNHWFFLSAFDWYGNESGGTSYLLHVIDGMPILKEAEL